MSNYSLTVYVFACLSLFSQWWSEVPPGVAQQDSWLHLWRRPGGQTDPLWAELVTAAHPGKTPSHAQKLREWRWNHTCTSRCTAVISYTVLWCKNSLIYSFYCWISPTDSNTATLNGCIVHYQVTTCFYFWKHDVLSFPKWYRVMIGKFALSHYWIEDYCSVSIKSQSNCVVILLFTVVESDSGGDQKVCSVNGCARCLLLKKIEACLFFKTSIRKKTE